MSPRLVLGSVLFAAAVAVIAPRVAPALCPGSEILSSVSVADGSFHHIAATYDGTTSRLYVDGTLSATGLRTMGAITVTGGHVTIGNSTAHNNDFDGAIDQVCLWSVARSPSQIASDMLTETPSGSGLVANWTLNGSGTDLVAGNTLSPTGSVSYVTGHLGQAADIANPPSPSYLEAPAPSSYSVGAGASFTIECWVMVRSMPGIDPRIIRCVGTTDGACGPGVSVWELWVCRSSCGSGRVGFGLQEGTAATGGGGTGAPMADPVALSLIVGSLALLGGRILRKPA